MVDETGAVVEKHDYYAYGLEMPGRVYVSGTPTREGFTGHELDAETGLNYAGARYYMPALGRWTSVDPLASSFASYSPYNYALNNPLSLTDPTGMAPSCPDPPCVEGPPESTDTEALWDWYDGRVDRLGMNDERDELAEYYVTAGRENEGNAGQALDAVFKKALELTGGNVSAALVLAVSAGGAATEDRISIGGNTDTAHHFFANAGAIYDGFPAFAVRMAGNRHERGSQGDPADLSANEYGLAFGAALRNSRHTGPASNPRMNTVPLPPGAIIPRRSVLPVPSLVFR